MLSVVNNDEAGAEARSGLDEICREGARTMLAAALEAEVDAYLAELVDERDENGHRLVTRNGHARRRKVQTVAGAVEIQAPRVNDRRVDEDDWQEGPVPLRHHPALVPQVPEGHRGPAAFVLARTLDRRLRPGPRGVLRFFGRVVGFCYHPAHNCLAGRAPRLHGPQLGRS